MPSVALSVLRSRVRQRADMENSAFVSDSELDQYINSSAQELYDIFVQADEDYNTLYTDLTISSGNTVSLPSTFYKLRGVDRKYGDLYIPIRRMQFRDRGRRSWNNRQYSVRYKLIAKTLHIYPEEHAVGTYRLWYVPEFTELVAITDTLDGMNGFEEYVVVDAAIKCLVKEESSTRELDKAKQALLGRIASMAEERDYAEPKMIADVSDFGYYDEEV